MSPSQVYRRSAAEFVGVVRHLTADQLGAKVAACPAWTVRDLLAHQAGSSADLVGGNVEGITTEPWSARQVEDRRTRTADELVAEWESNLDAVAARCDTITGPNPAWDVAVHLADLRESVGLPPGPAENGWGEVLVAAVGLVAQRGDTVSIAQCEPDPGDTTWHVATAYGLWRALFSRLDRTTLEREVLRGDVDRFAAAAFFSG
jgi:uncharacterized protein (TIGR03083 family)